MAKYQGGCACGSVRYATDAEPIMSGHCQCRKCQQLSGTGHATFAAFPAAALEVTGKVNYWNYVADSGNTASRGHCPVCGSIVLGRTSGFNDMVAVQLATLDDPAKITPRVVFYNDRAQPWDNLDAGFQRFPGMPPM
jgi:hypothetical protein